VLQKGSNITPLRLRFDFSHGEKMTDEQKNEVEKLINDVIQKDLPVTREEVSYEEARARGAIGIFDDKYGDKVSIYTVGTPGKRGDADFFSLEFCGGPHVEHTGVLGHFKIQKEEAVSQGIRRIKAILE
jgi:alanyl-tRNA synthetase